MVIRIFNIKKLDKTAFCWYHKIILSDYPNILLWNKIENSTLIIDLGISSSKEMRHEYALNWIWLKWSEHVLINSFYYQKIQI